MHGTALRCTVPWFPRPHAHSPAAPASLLVLSLPLHPLAHVYLTLFPCVPQVYASALAQKNLIENQMGKMLYERTRGSGEGVLTNLVEGVCRCGGRGGLGLGVGLGGMWGWVGWRGGEVGSAVALLWLWLPCECAVVVAPRQPLQLRLLTDQPPACPAWPACCLCCRAAGSGCGRS